jgi:hypothetical protein
MDYSYNYELVINLFINPYRIIDNKRMNYNGMFHRFICEVNSLEDYRNETNCLQSFKFSFKSTEILSLRNCSIQVYQFQDDCGIPDIPFQASTRIQDKTILYYPTVRKNYRMIGENIINCLFEGDWDNKPPIFEPIERGDMNGIDMKSSLYKRVEYQNFEYFNGTEVAVINSKIVFQCNNGENSSKILVSICHENRLWIGDDLKCK